MFEFLPWGSELKNQTITKKQYEKFNDKEPTINITNQI